MTSCAEMQALYTNMNHICTHFYMIAYHMPAQLSYSLALRMMHTGRAAVDHSTMRLHTYYQTAKLMYVHTSSYH